MKTDKKKGSVKTSSYIHKEDRHKLTTAAADLFIPVEGFIRELLKPCNSPRARGRGLKRSGVKVR
jgi:hypothetical protein